MTTQEKIDALLECIEKAQKLGIAATQNEFAELIGYSPVTLSAALANRGGKLTDNIVFKAQRAVTQATTTGDITDSPNSNTGTQTGVPASVVNNLITEIAALREERGQIREHYERIILALTSK